MQARANKSARLAAFSRGALYASAMLRSATAASFTLFLVRTARQCAWANNATIASSTPTFRENDSPRRQRRLNVGASTTTGLLACSSFGPRDNAPGRATRRSHSDSPRRQLGSPLVRQARGDRPMSLRANKSARLEMNATTAAGFAGRPHRAGARLRLRRGSRRDPKLRSPVSKSTVCPHFARRYFEAGTYVIHTPRGGLLEVLR